MGMADRDDVNMTDRFDVDWADAESRGPKSYTDDPTFELNFQLLGESFGYSTLWALVGSAGLGEYGLNIEFEEAFLRILEEYKLLNYDNFSEVWDVVGETLIDNKYVSSNGFEKSFDDYTFPILFDAFSVTNLNKFVNSEEFEKHFKAVAASVENQKDTTNKSTKDKKNNLKSLLESRMKRLKQMEEFMKIKKDDKSNRVTFECKTCGFQSRWQRKLFVSHIKPLHIKGTRESKRKKKKRPKKLILESKVDRKYICEDLDCYKVFSKIENRKRHMLNVHKLNLRRKCTTCNKHYRDHYNLERHKRLMHSKLCKKNVYKCPLCSFKTRFKFSLIRHEKIKHDCSSFDEDGRIVCDICRQTFTEKFSMERHMVIHDAINLGYNGVFCDEVKHENHTCSFSCLKCCRSFSCKSLLMSHMKIHDKLLNVSKYLTRLGDHDAVKNQIDCIKY